MLVTRHLVTSLCSIYCVVIIITSIITFMHWDGQQFGSHQSIAVVMLIGFSVDYVLHLSTDFMHSSQPTRALKNTDLVFAIWMEVVITEFAGSFFEKNFSLFAIISNVLSSS
jgi:predicted RND superfamily exporter protein